MVVDWKSADEIEKDVKAGETVEPLQLALDAWRRIDELVQHIERLERRLEALNSSDER
jgi:hypothetical protein